MKGNFKPFYLLYPCYDSANFSTEISYIISEGKMLFFLTIFVLILAALAFAIVARRSRRERHLPLYDPLNIDVSQFRPLFMPSDEELAAVEREKQDAIDAEQLETERLAREKKLANFAEFRQTWRASDKKENAAGLLARAIEFQNGEVFLETVKTILDERQNVDISDEYLAQLIESHFWLLPANERTPGVTFAVNEEIAALRKSRLSA